MTEVPDSKEKTIRRRRSRRPKGWKAIPKAVYLVAALCLGFLILIPLTRQPSYNTNSQPELAPRPANKTTATKIPVDSLSQPVADSVKSSDLQLPECALDRATLKMKGVAKNVSSRAYDNVRVTFEISDTDGVRSEVFAVVGRLEPQKTSSFETQPLPANWRAYSLPEITGSPK